MMSMKPLDKHLKSVDDYYLIQSINRLIEWNNDLEARLAALEHPVERPNNKVYLAVCDKCGQINHNKHCCK